MSQLRVYAEEATASLLVVVTENSIIHRVNSIFYHITGFIDGSLKRIKHATIIFIFVFVFVIVFMRHVVRHILGVTMMVFIVVSVVVILASTATVYGTGE